MDCCFIPMERRKFIEAAMVWSASLIVLPVLKLFSFDFSISDLTLKSGHIHSKDSFERLLKIALQYGGEFADVSVKPKLRSSNHGCI